ncbi:hypothetical protein [Methylobacterium brachiatum]|uniref:hypothetical protein n=1 Tax=Methylobacterium brachiatum TaxID=269660 RepID=UPI0008E582FD|nr:hypothetical protein [Methylobacterium brachiatum]SFI05112.1 hypothetical protein SAMN02799642_00540 [Methylobacterium brachiatum]
MTCSRDIPDFAQPIPRRVAFIPELAMGYGREHGADPRLSEARRFEPKPPGMGTVGPQARDALFLRLEAFSASSGEPTRYAENTVQADLVSAFRDGDRHYLLVVPAGGKPVRVDVTGRIGALFAYLGRVVERAGL